MQKEDRKEELAENLMYPVFNEEEEDDRFSQQPKKVMDLANLPANYSIDKILEEEDNVKPPNTRLNIVAEWNNMKGCYVISEEKEQQLQQYIPMEEWKATAGRIERDRDLRPFEKRASKFRVILLKALQAIVSLILAYAEFVVVQLFIFNPIIIGLMVYAFIKVFRFLSLIEIKFRHNQLNKAFFKFIEEENLRFYRHKYVELIGGKQGRWIEIKLPEDEDDKEEDLFSGFAPKGELPPVPEEKEDDSIKV